MSEPEHASHRRLDALTRSDRGMLLRSSVTVVARALAKAAQIIFLVIAARLLSVDEFASYSYILALLVVFTVVSDTGLPLVSSRDMSARRGTPGVLYWSAFPVVVVSAVLAAAALALFAGADPGPGSSAGAVALAAVFVIGNRFFDLGATTLRGLGRLNLDAALEAGGAAAFVAGATVVTATGGGVVAVLAVLCLKEWLFGALAYLAIRGEVGPPRRPDAERWRALLRTGIRLSLAATALALLMRVPLLVLGHSGTTHEVAAFSAAQRFGDAAVLLATSAGFALLPGVASLARDDPARARRLVWRVTAALVVGSAAVALATQPIAGDLMRIIFGQSFEGGGDALQIIAAGLPAYAVVGVSWYALIAFDGEAATLNVALVGLAVAAVVGPLTVPGGGETAASWTYVAALGTVALASLVALARRLAAETAAPAVYTAAVSAPEPDTEA